jgi:hypothetical protein
VQTADHVNDLDREAVSSVSRHQCHAISITPSVSRHQYHAISITPSVSRHQYHAMGLSVRAAAARKLRRTLFMTPPVRGIDHVAMTVPNLDDASRFLEEAWARNRSTMT